FSIPVTDLLTNGFDPDGRQLSTTVSASASSTNGGSIMLDGMNLLYTPPLNYVGPDAFSYTNTDCAGLSGLGAVFVTINAVPHGFGFVSLSFNTNQDTTVVAKLLLSGHPAYTYTLQR